MEMKKTDTMGNVPSKKQIVNVTYGHYGSGQLYSYYGQNKRAGDIVTPKVTHPKSGKKYKTLAVVESTHQLPNGQDTVEYLNNKGVKMKTIGKTDQKALPNYYQGWEKDAEAARDLKWEVLARNDIPKMEKLALVSQIRRLRKR